MGEDCSSAGSDDGQFDKTRWSMVLGAVQSRAPCAQKALADLCGLYWRPLYAFAEKRGGRAEVIRLDWQDAETRLVFEPEDRLTPETLYDAQWHCCFCAAPPSALSRNSSPFHRNTKNTNSSSTKEFSLRDRPVFFVELNKHGRFAALPKFDDHDANIRKNKRQWRLPRR